MSVIFIRDPKIYEESGAYNLDLDTLSILYYLSVFHIPREVG